MEYNWRNYCHPDLKGLTDEDFRIRTSILARLFYRKPADWVNWYGDCIRTFADGGNGMYATAEQAAAWPDKLRSDVTIGPS